MVKYWPEVGKCGYLVWRYLLRRDDQEPAPWTPEGIERIKKLGLTVQVGTNTSKSHMNSSLSEHLDVIVLKQRVAQTSRMEPMVL